MYDTIIVGSGLGGLTSASFLSSHGKKVLVLEKHFLLGGYANNFKRKGYNFDISLHGIGGLETGNLNNILKACNVYDKITPLKNTLAYSIFYKNKLIEIPNNIEDYKNLLICLFNDEKENIEKLFKNIYRFNNGFKSLILNKSFIGKFSLDVLLFINWSKKTLYDVLKEHTSNEEFIKIFSALWSYYGLPPTKLSSIYFFIPWISYHIHGKYYIQGGSKSLTDAFSSTIKENGGEILLKKEVVEILTDSKKAIGVKLSDGTKIYGKDIIFNGSPLNALHMLPKESLSEEKKIKNDAIGTSLTQAYIGLKCNPSKLNIPNDEVFFFMEHSHDIDYTLSLKGDYLNTEFLLTNYNSMDETLNHNDKGVITVTYIDNYDLWDLTQEDYKLKKEQVSKDIINRLESYYPGIKDMIEVFELGTPKTMERYTLNPKGAVYGYSQSLKASGRYRLKNKTSLKNLYFSGAWVTPGGGYEGAISSGISLASSLK